MSKRRREAGFVVSVEMMLIALVLGLGLITGWIKLRDQSLSEIKDTMAAIDAYVLGSAPLWQTGGTRWISTGQACLDQGLSSPCVLGPPTTGSVSEQWAPGAKAAPAAVETAPGSHLYRARDGFLVYGPAPTSEAQQ